MAAVPKSTRSGNEEAAWAGPGRVTTSTAAALTRVSNPAQRRRAWSRRRRVAQKPCRRRKLSLIAVSLKNERTLFMEMPTQSSGLGWLVRRRTSAGLTETDGRPSSPARKGNDQVLFNRVAG